MPELKMVLDGWSRHMRVLEGLTDRSISAYTEQVGAFFEFSPKPVDQVERADVEGYLEHLFYERSNQNHTRLTKLIALRKFFRYCAYERHVERDITEGIPRPRIRTKLIQTLTRHDVIEIFKQVDLTTEKGLRDTTILILLAFCGLRAGELCHLRIDDLVWQQGRVLVHIPEDIGKHGTTRVVELWKAPSVFVQSWVETRLQKHAARPSDRLIVSYRRGDRVNGNPLDNKDVDNLVKALAHKAGIRRRAIHAHMFRATHASDLQHIEGYTISAIAARMGHRQIATTDRYLRRERVKIYPSLRMYWIDWEKLWH